MNMNDNPIGLKEEEQFVLDELINQLDRRISNLDEQLRFFIKEARDINISINPDAYVSKLLSNMGIKDTEENRQKLLRTRDELYEVRLLLNYSSDRGQGIMEIKVGRNTYANEHGKPIIVSWENPICRYFLLDADLSTFTNKSVDSMGDKFITKYDLVAKNKIDLRFTRVKGAINYFPGILDEKTINEIKESGFLRGEFLEGLKNVIKSGEEKEISVSELIEYEFQKDLIERRSIPEFTDIIFSIQKKQGSIIKAPYNNSLIVQGCAGSGKSMIMLHRLPILLYDHPDSLSRTNLYIITPSQMYIQLVENMRHSLKISDIKMGTIEQYYDLCIGRYSGHKAGEYGKISYRSKISPDDERYIYSSDCIEDIRNHFDVLIKDTEVPIDKAIKLLQLDSREIRNTSSNGKTCSEIVKERIADYQQIINANRDSMKKYFKAINEAISNLLILKNSLLGFKDEVLRGIAKKKTEYEGDIRRAKEEIEKADSEKNERAIRNRERVIEVSQKNIETLRAEEKNVEEDNDYFDIISELGNKIAATLSVFESLKSEYSTNTFNDVYDAINNVGFLVGGYYTIAWELSRIEDKYSFYSSMHQKEIAVENSIDNLKGIKDQVLKIDYYKKIREAREELTIVNSSAVSETYEYILGKIGVHRTESGYLRAIKCSPYIYLQILYLFQGGPSVRGESLLSVDEAQSLAPEEIRLLKNINGDEVIMNMFGDIYQHIEGTKGIDSWDEINEIVNCDMYGLEENYRNASLITKYCNKTFDMNMKAINLPGSGVHELHSEEQFHAEMIKLLVGSQRAGLSAILVGDDAEARYLLSEFSEYEQKFHDTTDEDFSVHRTRWNIININEAKGLEFTSVFVISGRMSRNQKYIACTRALDDLYIYDNVIDIKEYEKKGKKGANVSEVQKGEKTEDGSSKAKHVKKSVERKNQAENSVKQFFRNKGLEVVDNRNDGGRLWVIGEKKDIKDIVDEAVSIFNLSGKYDSSAEIRYRQGWCTKTNK